MARTVAARATCKMGARKKYNNKKKQQQQISG
jgi:hypothetical protein